MKNLKNIIINKEHWQTRVAVTEDGLLQDLYFEENFNPDLEKTFFKGRVIKILPGIQTVFVDIGEAKAGFLHISEVDRNLAIDKFLASKDIIVEDGKGRPRANKNNISINTIFKLNEEILVQVKKEPIYSKGAKLTTCYTLPGKYVVLMPNIPQVGISSKIVNRAERERLRGLVQGGLPEEMGAVIRTDADGRSNAEIQSDLKELVDAWKEITKTFAQSKVGAKIHVEPALSLRCIREHLDNQTQAIYCDNAQDWQEVKQLVDKIGSEYACKVILLENEDVFTKFGLEEQVAQLWDKKVRLKSGGSIIIEFTEAMTVIDVNSGGYVGKTSQDDTSLKINLEAASEVVRQLRLRNIGGIVVIDFIDMYRSDHRQQLHAHLQEVLKNKDRFKSVTLNISEFGLVQMTRKRTGKTIFQQLAVQCHTCHGVGFVSSVNHQSYTLLHRVQQELRAKKGIQDYSTAELWVSSAVFDFLVQDPAASLLCLSKGFNLKITMVKNTELEATAYRLLFLK